MNWTRAGGWILGVGLGVLVIGWSLRRSEEPWKLLVRWIITVGAIAGIWFLFGRFFSGASGWNPAAAFILGIGAAVLGLILAVTWTPSLILLVTSPLTRLFYDDHQEIEPTPLYSAAHAQRKKGNYNEAIAVVQQQLDRFPDDLNGTLLLAEIHAVDLGDLATAEGILEKFVQRTEPPNAVVALSLMADWRLGLKEDVNGAREAFERIRSLCPDTEAAYMAAQRLAHLADAASIEAVQHPKSIEYVEFPRPERVGEVVEVRPKAVEPTQETSDLVRHLERFPEDFDARERLATLYAEHFKRMDLARMQMEELISNKRAPQKKVVAWLNRLADLELQGAPDTVPARAALQRIIDMNPKMAAAEQARRRMNLLERELKRYR